MHYKDKNNNIHFIDDDSFKYLLPVGCIEVDNQPPSKYHVWDDKAGWNISKEDQTTLASDILKSGEEKEKAALLSVYEAKVQQEMRSIAISNLKESGEIPKDFI